MLNNSVVDVVLPIPSRMVCGAKTAKSAFVILGGYLESRSGQAYHVLIFSWCPSPAFARQSTQPCSMLNSRVSRANCAQQGRVSSGSRLSFAQNGPCSTLFGKKTTLNRYVFRSIQIQCVKKTSTSSLQVKQCSTPGYLFCVYRFLQHQHVPNFVSAQPQLPLRKPSSLNSAAAAGGDLVSIGH